MEKECKSEKHESPKDEMEHSKGFLKTALKEKMHGGKHHGRKHERKHERKSMGKK